MTMSPRSPAGELLFKRGEMRNDEGWGNNQSQNEQGGEYTPQIIYLPSLTV